MAATATNIQYFYNGQKDGGSNFGQGIKIGQSGNFISNPANPVTLKKYQTTSGNTDITANSKLTQVAVKVKDVYFGPTDNLKETSNITDVTLTITLTIGSASVQLYSASGTVMYYAGNGSGYYAWTGLGFDTGSIALYRGSDVNVNAILDEIGTIGSENLQPKLTFKFSKTIAKSGTTIQIAKNIQFCITSYTLNTKPTEPILHYPTNNAITYNSTPHFSMTGIDPDGGNLAYQYKYSDGDWTTVQTVASGTKLHFNLPQMADGTYTVNIRTYDGLVPSDSIPVTFRIDSSALKMINASALKKDEKILKTLLNQLRTCLSNLDTYYNVTSAGAFSVENYPLNDTYLQPVAAQDLNNLAAEVQRLPSEVRTNWPTSLPSSKTITKTNDINKVINGIKTL